MGVPRYMRIQAKFTAWWGEQCGSTVGNSEGYDAGKARAL